MENFQRTLYEAVLVAFGKVLAKYNAFAQGSILKDVGKELINYLECPRLYPEYTPEAK